MITYSISKEVLGSDDPENTAVLYWYLDATRGSWMRNTPMPGIADILIDSRYGDSFYYEILSEDFPDLDEVAMYDIGSAMDPEYFIGRIETKLLNFAKKHRMAIDMTPYNEEDGLSKVRCIVNSPQKGVW